MRPAVWLVTALIGVGSWQASPQIDEAGRNRVKAMLRQAYDNVRKNYYDPKFHGLDLDARYREFDERVKTAASLNAGMMLVADFLDGLDDSHTYFLPPNRPYDFDYGYRYQALGDRVFITQVRPGSDAAAKLKIGDEVLAINGVPLDRAGVTRLTYALTLLAPQPSTSLTVKSPGGEPRNAVVTTRT